jgi:hypothetical protein
VNNQLGTVHAVALKQGLIKDDHYSVLCKSLLCKEFKPVVLTKRTIQKVSYSHDAEDEGWIYVKSSSKSKKDKIIPVFAHSIRTDDFPIYRLDNVLPSSLACDAREFVLAIEIPEMIELLDDGSNPPLDNIFLLNNENSNESVHWIVEGYNSAFYRYAPSSMEAYLQSPIKQVIVMLNQKIRTWQPHLAQYGISWVLQVIKKGHCIYLHDDKAVGRLASFVYYLTENGWNNTDGGNLEVCTGKYHYNIPPEFNSLVYWDMVDETSPLHAVSQVKSDRKRIALVGFIQNVWELNP